MLAESSDAELVAALVGGQSSALAVIYDRYAPSLYDTARAMLRDADDAADVMQDVIVVAAARIGQLRDPTRLKPWLFAILRNEVYRRSRSRSRTTATDFRTTEAEAVLPPTPSDDGTNLEYAELAALVRDAAGGLDPRDQFVLELSVRQGLSGADLADALGVSAQESYNLVHRMRQRVERSLGALLVARHGRADCAELAKILDGWDGRFSVLIRKRVARHVDGCEVCERTRIAAAPLSLVAAAPVFTVPDGLRDRVLAAAGKGSAEIPYGFDNSIGFPTIVRAGRKLAVLLGIAAVVLLAGGAGVVWSQSGDSSDAAATIAATTTDPAPSSTEHSTATEPDTTPTSTTVSTSTSTSTSSTSSSTSSSSTSTSTSSTSSTSTTSTSTTTSTTVPPAAPPPAPPPPDTTTAPPVAPPPAPGQLVLSSTAVDFGSSVSSVVVTLSNPGGQPVNWSVTFTPAGFASSPFSIAPASGTIAAGGSQQVTVSFDRAAIGEGTYAGSATFAAAGTSASVHMSGTVARPPELQVLVAPPAEACARTMPTFTWRLSIVDETGPISVGVTVTTPTGATISATTTSGGSFWGATAPRPVDANGNPIPGAYRWTVVATDGIGSTATASGTTILLPRC